MIGGMRLQRAKYLCQRLLISRLDRLIAQKKHLVLIEQLAQRLGQLGIDAVSQIDRLQLGAYGSRYSLDDHPIISCVPSTLLERGRIVLVHDVGRQ